MRPESQLGPCLLTRHCGTGGSHVDQLETSQVTIRARRVVDLNELIGRGYAPGHDLTDNEANRRGPGYLGRRMHCRQRIGRGLAGRAA
jgi:hypothetical protein